MLYKLFLKEQKLFKGESVLLKFCCGRRPVNCVLFSKGMHIYIRNFIFRQTMMTSSNGSIFRVTGHLCGELAGEFLAQRPLTGSFDVFFDLGLNKLLSKQWWGWWFETTSRPLWRHCNARWLKTLQTIIMRIPTVKPRISARCVRNVILRVITKWLKIHSCV